MKQELSQIYRGLSAGGLSQQEALERIRTLKRNERAEPMCTLLASPVWEPVTLAAAPQDTAPEYAQHQIVLCDLPQIAASELESLLPGSRCAAVQATRSESVSEAYTRVAL